MISIPRAILKRIDKAAETAYPRECCGLLAGTHEDNGDISVTRVRPSRNIAGSDRPDRFEIDPETRFALMRDIGEFDRLENGSDSARKERIVGHYHSHPDSPSRPSAYDLEMAFEPDLFWLIVSVENGRAAAAAIHRLDAASHAFQEIAFTTR